jgi:hypothetical protein
MVEIHEPPNLKVIDGMSVALLAGWSENTRFSRSPRTRFISPRPSCRTFTSSIRSTVSSASSTFSPLWLGPQAGCAWASRDWFQCRFDLGEQLRSRSDSIELESFGFDDEHSQQGTLCCRWRVGLT